MHILCGVDGSLLLAFSTLVRLFGGKRALCIGMAFCVRMGICIALLCGCVVVATTMDCREWYTACDVDVNSGGLRNGVMM